MRNDVIAVGLLWAAMPFTHLLDLGYTFFAVEVWGLSALFLMVGSTLVYGFGKLGLQSVLVAASLFLLICIYFLDTSGTSAILLFALYAALYVVSYRGGGQVLIVVSTFAVIFSLSNLFIPKADAFDSPLTESAQIGTPKNALVHIILDEQASPDAMAHTIPSRHMALSIYDDYAQRGFRMYRTVRSVHHHTSQSLPNLVSLDGDTDNLAPFNRDDDHISSVKSNPQLEKLVAHGYRVRVLQSSYLDLCANVTDIDCRSYPIRDMSVFQTRDLSLKDRLLTAVIAISRDYTNLNSGRYVGAYKLVGSALYAPDKSFRYLSWPIKTLEAIDRLQTELKDIRPGDAFVVHLLVPHFPYVLNSDCTPSGPGRWAYPVRQGPKQDPKDIHKAYWDQSACSHKKIMQVLDAIADKPFTTVFVHGDHGARFYTDTDAASKADDLDTFLAVKSVNEPQTHKSGRPLLQDVFAREFKDFIEASTQVNYLH